MGPTDLALEALDYVSTEGDATIAAAKAGQLRRIAHDLTATMQEIYSLASALYKRRDGYVVADPQSITATVANGALTLTTAATLIDGSTILVGGDDAYNIVSVDKSGTKLLTLPYKGISGTYSATVWNDVVPLATTVDRVIGAVLLNEKFPLDKRVNRRDALTHCWPESDYGRRLWTASNQRRPGQPDSYWVESFFINDGTAASHVSRLRMHLYPMPQQSYTIAYDVRVRAPQFAVVDLGTDTTASTVPMVVAADMVEAIVRPLFIKRWSGSPWFRNKDAMKEIGDQAVAARALLTQYRAQQPSNRRITAPL